jgi:hypothetical protein
MNEEEKIKELAIIDARWGHIKEELRDAYLSS